MSNTAKSSDSGYADSEDGLHRLSSSGKSLHSAGSDRDLDDSIPDSPDNVSVIVRVRHLNTKEISRNEFHGLQFPGEGRILVDSFQNNGKPKLFTFNVVFEPEASQEDVFEHSGVKQLIDMALDGFSSTIFAYGQTGSGKTYTLTGPPLVNDKLVELNESQGLMVRSFQYLFQQLHEKQDVNCVIHASFLEIYNEQVMDLLNPGSQKKYLQVRWARNKGFYVENLFIIECVELDDVLAVLEEGLRNRQVAPNIMNENSSRSHSILTLNILSEIRISEDDNTFITKQGKLTFVDLAGSEKVSEHGKNKNENLNETNKINRSLLTLGKCISALGEGKKKGQHIPYRDSKLTKLLADSLGGNGVTLMIACVSPARSSLAESLNTLRYASRTKQIKNKPVVIMDPRETTILSLRREVKLLKAENQYLRQLLEFPKNTEKKYSAIMKSSSLQNFEKLREAAEKNGSLPPELNSKELYDMLKEYMVENEALRDENAELLRSKDLLVHDLENVCRENERLFKKLEDKERVSKSPMSIKSPYRESLNESSERRGSKQSPSTTNIWVNGIGDLGTTFSGGNFMKPTMSNESNEVALEAHPLPENLSRELNRRKIGSNINDNNKPGNSTKFSKHIRHRSWENHEASRNTPLKTPPTDPYRHQQMMSNPKRNISPKATHLTKSISDQSLNTSSTGTNDKIKSKIQAPIVRQRLLNGRQTLDEKKQKSQARNRSLERKSKY